MKKLAYILFIGCFLSLAIAGQASAQTSGELQLGLNKDFGYGGFGDNIQGLFTLRVKNAPNNLTRVVFFIDGKSMGEATQAPFSLQFNTDLYPLGNHTLSAVGYTADGQEINSNQISAVFVSASQSGQTMIKIILPIVGILIVAVVISFLIPTVFNKGKFSSMAPGTPRNYGFGGGAVCPKCGRPFPIRLWWMHFGPFKIDRCPFCGKWSFIRRASMDELRNAEQAELASTQPEAPIAGESEEERLKKELDDSRYQNM